MTREEAEAYVDLLRLLERHKDEQREMRLIYRFANAICGEADRVVGKEGVCGVD